MLELFKKSIYATIGLAVLTREKVEELGKVSFRGQDD